MAERKTQTMVIRHGIAGLALTLSLVGCAKLNPPVNEPVGQRAHWFEREFIKTVRADYLLYLPKEYNDDPDRLWPTILFLHGAGERGNDLEKVKKHGPPKLVAERDFPFIIASPQCPAGEWWTLHPDTVIALLDEVSELYRVDPDRVYLTGLSMGGYGTWATAVAYPDEFAAIAPICGAGSPFMAGRIKHLPIWVFHGTKDKVVPIERSEEMVARLKRAGADVKFTVYPDADHDSWTETYNNPELYEWFLRHKRKPRPPE